MKSMHLTGSAGPALTQRDAPRPEPGPGEVVVQVHAAGVTPTEVFWYPTLHTTTGAERTEAVPSHEFSGEIAVVGDGVTDLTRGDAVYGMNDWFADGALAEYCVTRPEWLAPKPRRLSHVEAASVPIGALTAWQGLFDRAGLRSEEMVLVHGGAGAVGVFAVQLARSRGAYVITTVSAHNADFVKALGAHETLDYKAARFEEHVRNIDVVFDAVGGETLQRSWGVLNQTGRLVTIAADSEGTADERTKQAFFIVEPRRQQLVEIANLLDSGALRTFVDAVVPLAQATDAFTGRLAKKGRGKVVVAVTAAAQ